MDDDYVNKHIVCPTCGGREFLYIDLNDIQTDPKVNTGTVVRSFSHHDHLLLLDIDTNGDVRNITQIDKKQEVEINHEKYNQIREFIREHPQSLIISQNYHIDLLIQSFLQEQLDAMRSFHLECQPDRVSFTDSDHQLLWYRGKELNHITEGPWDGIILDRDENLDDDETLRSFLHTADHVACFDTTTYQWIEHTHTDIEIQLFS